jgi:hypothetical protein
LLLSDVFKFAPFQIGEREVEQCAPHRLQVSMAADDKGPQIECPLCHSKFLLADGTVVDYCPKDGPMQWVVGTIKEKTPPENTKVRP